MPRTRSVIATEAVRAAAAAGSEAAVTLVPVVAGADAPDVDLDGVRVRVLVDESPAADAS
jgi:predicted methyltransferase